MYKHAIYIILCYINTISRSCNNDLIGEGRYRKTMIKCM